MTITKTKTKEIMELINLKRILPQTLLELIDQAAKDFAKDDKHKIFYGQLRIGDPPHTQDQIVDVIINAVCAYFRVTRHAVLSRSRIVPLITSRQIIHYMSRKHTDLTTAEIGVYIGGRDHSTVLHSLKTVDNYMTTNKSFRQKIDEIDKIINQMIIKESIQKIT